MAANSFTGLARLPDHRQEIRILIPGILARVQEQFEPVLPALAHGAAVVGYTYPGRYFDPVQIATELANAVSEYFCLGWKRVTLVGASLGGRLIPDVLERMLDTRLHVSHMTQLRCVLVDAPYDGESLAAIPEIALPLARLALKFTPSTQANDGYGKWLMNRLFNDLPKDDAIVVPNDEIDAAAYRHRIKQTAARNLAGHDFAQLYTQLRYMATTSKMAHLLDRVERSHYVECTRRNVTIRQPQAVTAYREAAAKLHVQTVETAHCAFLEAQPVWNQAFATILN